MNNLHNIQLSESKSFANRSLIISSFGQNILPEYRSRADDIVELRNSLNQLKLGEKEFHIGEGGTTFRFLLTRLSREKGDFTINARPQLLSRPQEELYRILEELGAKISATHTSVRIEANGWENFLENDGALNIDCSKSTQFASAILLCGFHLNKDLKINLLNFNKSISYLRMTEDILTKSGMVLSHEFEQGIECVIVQKNAKVKKLIHPEPDMSSAFSIAAIGVVSGGKILSHLPINSIQGDSVFINILKQMNVSYKIEEKNDNYYNLIIDSNQSDLKPINVDLGQCPDLLPVLSALCSMSNGTSYITNIEHTRYKESDRIAKSEELLKKAGCLVGSSLDGMTITGPLNKKKFTFFEFDPENDHRMAMAAAVLKAYGVPIKILTPHVVNKSYPDFWKDSLVNP